MPRHHVVAASVPRNCTILGAGRTLTDRRCADDPAVIVCLLRVMPGPANVSSAPQMFKQFLFEGPAGLGIEPAANHFVRHVLVLVTRVCLVRDRRHAGRPQLHCIDLPGRFIWSPDLLSTVLGQESKQLPGSTCLIRQNA